MQQNPPTLLTATASSEPSPSCGRAVGIRTLSARRIPAPMGSGCVTPPPCTVGELPLLPTIGTIVVRHKPAAAEGAAADGAVAEEECVTPKADVHVLKPAAACPPAPRKPRPAKRAVAPSKSFQGVTCDLESVFRILPPKKRIRVG